MFWTLIDIFRVSRKVCVCRIQSKNYSVWSASLESRQREECASLPSLLSLCLACLASGASPGWKQRILERQRERERQLFWAAQEEILVLHWTVILHVTCVRGLPVFRIIMIFSAHQHPPSPPVPANVFKLQLVALFPAKFQWERSSLENIPRSEEV